MIRQPPRAPLFPYPPLFRSPRGAEQGIPERIWVAFPGNGSLALDWLAFVARDPNPANAYLLVDYPGYGRSEGYARSEEHTSELQSRQHLVCRLLLAKKTLSHRYLGATANAVCRAYDRTTDLAAHPTVDDITSPGEPRQTNHR